MATESDQVRHERTAQRAYEIWEREGRPGDRHLDHWLAAETELKRESEAQPTEPTGEDQTPAPAVTNLDRALPAEERARARAERRGSEQASPQPPAREHFIVVADRAAVRIFAEEHPLGRAETVLRLIQTQLFPGGHEDYFERDTSPQGRFPSNTRDGGMSIDERLPMQREQERRLIHQIGTTIAGFLKKRPRAVWDFAAGASLYRAILDELDPAIRNRVGTILPKELSKASPESLLAHFAAASALPS